MHPPEVCIPDNGTHIDGQHSLLRGHKLEVYNIHHGPAAVVAESMHQRQS